MGAHLVTFIHGRTAAVRSGCRIVPQADPLAIPVPLRQVGQMLRQNVRVHIDLRMQRGRARAVARMVYVVHMCGGSSAERGVILEDWRGRSGRAGCRSSSRSGSSSAGSSRSGSSRSSGGCCTATR